MIEKFLSQRIKVIYKNITEIRRTETKPLVDDNKSLDDAEQDVQAWAESKDKKIASLQELADYRRNYIGNVSHEMKTPIFNVQGYIHTLLDGAINDAEVNMTFLTKASRNVERLQHIVEDLETIAKLETGKMVLDLQTFDLYQLAVEIFEELEIKALNKQAKLGFKNDMAKSFFVRADKEYIRQVLNNLINNSIKYGKIGGNTKIGFYDMDKVILTEVSDNGIGIAPQHLKHLFDRFYRVDRNRSRDVGGTGLGLSIVKHILEAHNQSVHVRSTENVGTTFSFTLEKAEVPVAKK
jgi:two-component system phosphate regulon sensor histidine kinase PhoR